MTTVGEERRLNPRLTLSEEEFVRLMEGLQLPRPKLMGNECISMGGRGGGRGFCGSLWGRDGGSMGEVGYGVSMRSDGVSIGLGFG